jgi:hypothetical protein
MTKGLSVGSTVPLGSMGQYYGQQAQAGANISLNSLHAGQGGIWTPEQGSQGQSISLSHFRNRYLYYIDGQTQQTGLNFGGKNAVVWANAGIYGQGGTTGLGISNAPVLYLRNTGSIYGGGGAGGPTAAQRDQNYPQTLTQPLSGNPGGNGATGVTHNQTVYFYNTGQIYGGGGGGGAGGGADGGYYSPQINGGVDSTGGGGGGGACFAAGGWAIPAPNRGGAAGATGQSGQGSGTGGGGGGSGVNYYYNPPFYYRGWSGSGGSGGGVGQNGQAGQAAFNSVAGPSNPGTQVVVSGQGGGGGGTGTGAQAPQVNWTQAGSHN